MARRLRALMVVAVLVLVAGCGQRPVPVTGVVKLDGKPVAGAAVTFLSSDGKHTATGTTDDGGNFTLSCTEGEGAFPAEYKVTVSKYPKVAGGVPGVEGSGKMDPEYEKAMKEQLKLSKTPAGAKMPSGVKMGSGVQPPAGMMPMPGTSSGHSSAKSELPETYANIETTPFKVKIPSDGPVQLDLKSKP
jgi:hypothetical protein